jgi:hypothetical protein
LSSIVVITVDVVMRSPSRMAMSPMTPVVGAVTRKYWSWTRPSRTCASRAARFASAVERLCLAASNSFWLMAPALSSDCSRSTCAFQ